MSGVTDYEIYQRLTGVVEELEEMFARGPSLVGGATLNTACHSLRGMARVLYEHSVGGEDPELNIQ